MNILQTEIQINSAKMLGPVKKLVYLGLQLDAEQQKIKMLPGVRRALQSVQTEEGDGNWRNTGWINFPKQATMKWRVAHFYYLYHDDQRYTIQMPPPIPWTNKNVTPSGTILYTDATPESMAHVNSHSKWWLQATTWRYQFYNEQVVLTITNMCANEGAKLELTVCRPWFF